MVTVPEDFYCYVLRELCTLSLPVRSDFSGRLLILRDLPQMFYTFLVFRVFYVLETTFVFHFMNIKESIQVLEEEFILTTQW